MEIANPLYDHAFKYLMSQERLARKVLSTILDKDVIHVQLSQNEITITDEERFFTLYRLDFKAQIKDEQGNVETVLIELQKSKLPTNVLRFRSYLGDTYMKRHNVKQANGVEKQVAYPIISIYIIGYQLADIPVMAAKVDRQILDVSENTVLEIKSDFVDMLTHPCYILQVRRLPQERRTKIERFMTFFNQAWVKEKRYILDLEEVPEGFEDIAEALQKPLLQDSIRQQLLAEQELEDYFAQQEAEKKTLLNDNKSLLDDNKSLLNDLQASQAKVEQERQEKEAALARETEAKYQLARMMLNYGESIAKIIAATGLTESEIHALK